ncbi:hypothetical protein ACF06P_30825 [Streptomyces sp. NPDC015684]|uniref:hypothetical protein n=1 Tax=Streptomyces sp. NPDC015684 TaxID=3364963 RepID=UPI0036F95558
MTLIHIAAAVELGSGQDRTQQAGHEVRGHGVVGDLVEEVPGVLVVPGTDGDADSTRCGQDAAQAAVLDDRSVQEVQQAASDARLLLAVLRVGQVNSGEGRHRTNVATAVGPALADPAAGCVGDTGTA